MIAGIYFNYQEILKKAKIADKEIDFTAPNSQYLKRMPYTSFGTGFLLMIIVWFCSLVGVVWGNFSLLDSFLTSIFVFFLVSFVSLFSLTKKMDIFAYQKLRKCKKKNFQVYEYKARIDGIYESIGVSSATNMKTVKDTKSKNFILVVDGEKIYINKKVYEDINKETHLRLYIAKIGNAFVLFDYKKV